MQNADGTFTLDLYPEIDDSHLFSPASLEKRGIVVDQAYRDEFEAMKKLSQGDLSDVPTTPAPPTK